MQQDCTFTLTLLEKNLSEPSFTTASKSSITVVVFGRHSSFTQLRGYDPAFTEEVLSKAVIKNQKGAELRWAEPVPHMEKHQYTAPSSSNKQPDCLSRDLSKKSLFPVSCEALQRPLWSMYHSWGIKKTCTKWKSVRSNQALRDELTDDVIFSSSRLMPPRLLFVGRRGKIYISLGESLHRQL